MENELRCFFFGNFYFSPIQQGIQAQHTQREMALKYLPPDPEEKIPFGTVMMYDEYARHHKTVVLKNGGDNDSMRDILALMKHEYNELPWGYFIEPGTGNTLSSIGIVVPNRIFDELVKHVGDSYRKKVVVEYNQRLNMWTVSEHGYMGGTPIAGEPLGQYSDFEWKLAELIRNTKLAR
jgi:hypothetical protein